MNGNVKSLKHNNIGNQKLLKQCKDTKGYLQVHLSRKNQKEMYLVHRLVAEAFIPNPEKKPCVNHKNGIKTDNRVDNLEWCTYSENNKHAWKIGLQETTPKQRLHSIELGKTKGGLNAKKVVQYDLQDNLIKEWKSATEAGKQLKIYHSNIISCCLKKYGFKTAGGYKWRYKEDI